jgi:uncharacterized membrane-anchored protein
VRRLAEIFSRVPRPLLFALAALIQMGLIAAMVVDRARILRDGADVTIQTRPVDPRDFLRGDYVALGYDFSNVPAALFKDQTTKLHNGAHVFVRLAPNRDGIYEMVSAHAEQIAVTAPDVLIRGRIERGADCGLKRQFFCDNLWVRYGIEKYFVPQGEGLEIERLRNERKVQIVAAVTPAGRAAIKRLLIDGKPVYDEPWF